MTPYAFNYDMVVFGWVIVKLMDRADNNGCDYALMLAVWIIPFLTVPLGIAGVPISSLPMFAFAIRLLWRMHKLQTAQSTSRDVTHTQQGAILAPCPPIRP